MDCYFFQGYRYKCLVKNIIKVIILSLCYKRFCSVYKSWPFAIPKIKRHCIFRKSISWVTNVINVYWLVYICSCRLTSLSWRCGIHFISLNVNKWLVCGNFGYSMLSGLYPFSTLNGNLPMRRSKQRKTGMKFHMKESLL